MRNILTGKKQIGLWARSARMCRWIPSAVIAVAVAGLFSLAAPSAKADTWDFSLTDPSNTTNIDFSFDTNFASTDLGNHFQLNSPVEWTLNGVDQGAATLSLWNLSSGGGLAFGDVVNLWGPQLYTGPESAPTIQEGTYGFVSCCGYQFDGPFTLTVADPVATPEPSGILLLGAGLLGMLGLAGYQSRRGKLATSDLA